MKTQAECWQALLDGKTLIGPDGNKIKLIDGFVKDYSGDIVLMQYPECWEIYQPPYTIEQIEIAWNSLHEDRTRYFVSFKDFKNKLERLNENRND